MGMIMKNGVPYASGSEIPEGGTKGQVLAKASNISGDFEWVNGRGSGGGISPGRCDHMGAHALAAQVGKIFQSGGDAGPACE